MTGGWLLAGLVPGGRPRLEGAPEHVLVEAAGLAALLTPRPDALAGPGPAEAHALGREVMAHHRLLAAWLAEGDVLPVRFGTAIEGPEAARRLLSREAEVFAAALAEVAGAEEWAVRLEPARAAAAPSRDGRAYLAARAERRRARARSGDAAAALAERLAAPLAALAGRAPLAGPAAPGRGRLAELSALVPKTRRPALFALADRAAAEAREAGLALALSGPWPPYRFAPAAISLSGEAVA